MEAAPRMWKEGVYTRIDVPDGCVFDGAGRGIINNPVMTVAPTGVVFNFYFRFTRDCDPDIVVLAGGGTVRGCHFDTAPNAPTPKCFANVPHQLAFEGANEPMGITYIPATGQAWCDDAR